MTLPAGWFDDAVRVRTAPAGEDEWGYETPGAETRTPLPPCLLAWTIGDEESAGAAARAVQTPSALWPDLRDVDVAAGDALIIRGDRYEVVGLPEHWPAGTRAQLRRTTT